MAAAIEIAKGLVRAGTKAAAEAERSLDKVVRNALEAMRKDELAYAETLPINAALRGDVTPENAKEIVAFLEMQNKSDFPDMLKHAHDVRSYVNQNTAYAGPLGRTEDDMNYWLFNDSSNLRGEDIDNISRVAQDMALQSLMAKGMKPKDLLQVYRAPQAFGSVAEGGTAKVEGALSFTQDAPRFFTVAPTPRTPTPAIQFEVPVNKVLTDTSAFPEYAPLLRDEAEIQALRKDALRRMSFDDQYQMMKQLGLQ
jgi:hypothetical protein